MRTIKTMAGILGMLCAIMVLPAVAAADSPICHNGILSDDAGQGCSDGLYAATYGNGGGSSNSGGDICHDGILSNDAGQGCSDAQYTSGGAAPASSGGSGNSMVDPSCESGGNSQVVSSNGLYWGKYQFLYSTWVASGGSPGSYGSASEAEQDRVAANVTYDAWPNC